VCELTTLALTASAVSGGLSAVGAYQQGQVNKQVAYNNARMAEYAAADAQRRGEEEAQAVRRKGDQVKGAQRARMAAAGLDLGVGTAAELQDQTDFFSETDQSTARFNASREAWSNREQAKQLRAQGSAAARQGTMSAFGTLLGTGGQVADKWRTYSGGKPAFQGYGGRY
jgi:hypothetical protein